MLYYIDSSQTNQNVYLIKRILDPSDLLDNEIINIDEYKNNIRHYYQKILDTGYSPEDFFEMIRIKNKRLESRAEDDEEEKAILTEVAQTNACNATENYINQLPNELLTHLVFSHLPLRQLFMISQVCKNWLEIFKTKNLMSIAYDYIIKNEIWPDTIYEQTPKFVFASPKMMIKNRPRLRFDGIYVCKFHYMRFGSSEVSEYRPCHSVISFKYIRFFPNGTYSFVYHQQPPLKMLSKFLLKNKILSDSQQDGTYMIRDDKLVMFQEVPHCD